MERSPHVTIRPNEEVIPDVAITHIENVTEKAPQGVSNSKVLRPGDAAMRRIRASVVAALVGFGGAVTPDTAQADAAGDAFGRAVAIGVINRIANEIQHNQSAPQFGPGVKEQFEKMQISYDPKLRLITNATNIHDAPISFGPKTRAVRINIVGDGIRIETVVDNGSGGTFSERFMVTSEIIRAEGLPDKRVLKISGGRVS